jgi:hypothetical protein
VFAYHYVAMLPVGLVAHWFLAWLYKKDEHIVDVYFAYSRQADTYDPWPHATSRVKRPEGFGRGLLC